MCYDFSVMLRVFCSCAISERPRPSPAPKYPLSPIIPVHPRNSPVSPMIPVHTQKQGGGAYFFLIAACSPPVLSASSAVNLLPAFSGSPLATRLPATASAEEGHSLARRSFSGGGPLTPIIPEPLATAALRVVPASIFTTTLRTHVGAPTISFRGRTTASKQFPDRRALLFSSCALLTVDCELLFSPKSNHSRTYESLSRKSNDSRTYAKTGGVGGVLSVWYRI